MDAVILAAGEGSRLDRDSGHLPKIFIELDGDPLYAYQLRELDKYCDRILIMLGHGFEDDLSPRDSFKVPESVNAEIEFRILSEWANYENGYTAVKALEDIEDHVLLVCGDVFFKQSVVQALISEFKDRCRREGKNVVGAIEGVQNEMTAVQTGPNGEVSTYGAIEGHQEVGLFLLNKSNINKAISILEENMDYWFPIVFEKTSSNVVFVGEDERHEVNTKKHLVEIKQKFGISID